MLSWFVSNANRSMLIIYPSHMLSLLFNVFVLCYAEHCNDHEFYSYSNANVIVRLVDDFSRDEH